MKFSVKQLIEVTGAKVLKNKLKTNACKFEISTDTRKIDETKVFLPIIGERFDGHDFIKTAVKSGVICYFTQKDIVLDGAKLVLQVGNTTETYLKLARYYKNLIKPKTIAITGSAGKTTTKEMAYHIFSKGYKTHKTELNHNNEIGLAQTLLSMPNDTQVLIVEMGMRGLGEIELLSKYANPDIAIITNIGSAHIGRLGSKENIAKAKFEIAKHLKRNGILITHKNEYLDKINNIKDRTTIINSDDIKVTDLNYKYSKFKYKKTPYRVNLSGEYNIQNAVLVIEAALRLGVPKDIIKKGLKAFEPIQNRWQVEKILNANIINDAYNANPESMLAAAKNFVSVYKGRKFLVLGDMGELGKKEGDIHAELGESLYPLNYDIMITVGDLSRNISDVDTNRSIHYMTVEGCSYYLKNNLKKGDWVLIKGSRSMGLERIVENLKKVEEKQK